MPTRRQDPETKTFRQGAFASSAEHERGILGNLVAARCHKLTDPEEIAMIWWLQQVSWRDGGLEKFAADFLSHNRAKVGTRSMFKLGCGPGRIYSAAEVRLVREEMEDPSRFPLKGERREDLDPDPLAGVLNDRGRSQASWDAAKKNPESYPAAAFVAECAMSDTKLAESLKRALVDPQSASLRDGYWNFPSLWEALTERRQIESDAAGARIVETAVTRQIAEELDFALETRSFVLIEGREGIGKSEAARTWCEQHPGRTVYVRLEAGSDETTLFRSIARRVGTACSYQRKAVEMRARIQDALQGGRLMLVLDEAHFLWPQSDRSERTVPKRLDWLRTALVDFGVPVAMVSTPQHFTRQCDRFRKNGWNANQIQRRLARTVTLPESLSADDAVTMARAYFPECPSRLLKRTAGAALLSVHRLTLFSHMRKRVDFFAARRPGLTEAELLEAALAEIGAPGGGGAGAHSEPIAEPVQGHRNRLANPLPQTETASTNRLGRAVQELVPAGI
jgi:DNA transposition AAA+ family ATPase